MISPPCSCCPPAVLLEQPRLPKRQLGELGAKRLERLVEVLGEMVFSSLVGQLMDEQRVDPLVHADLKVFLAEPVVVVRERGRPVVRTPRVTHPATFEPHFNGALDDPPSDV